MYIQVNPANGVWARLDEDAEQEDGAAEQAPPQRVVPIVQDNKNAALLRLAGEMLPKESMATLQHALIRGLELSFQVEEGEVLVAPTPSSEERRALLAYEASEGGAGVLGRLAAEPGMLAQVARNALEMMHYKDPSAAIVAADPALLQDVPEADCVKGCYRCLLSYYNQPDHGLIDRKNDAALHVLLRLARATVALQSPRSCDAPAAGSWHAALTAWGIPRPDDQPLDLAGVVMPLAWRDHLVGAGTEADIAQAQTLADAQGYVLVGLPPEPGASPPPGLLEALGLKT